MGLRACEQLTEKGLRRPDEAMTAKRSCGETMLPKEGLLRECGAPHDPALSESVRLVDGVPIFGVLQPSLDGLKAMLGEVRSRCRPHRQKILWICTQEDPMLFMNGSPHSCSLPVTVEQRCEDLSLPQRLDSVEAALKQEVLTSALHSGQVLVQNAQGHETVLTSPEVLTLQEAFMRVEPSTFAGTGTAPPASLLHLARVPVEASGQEVGTLDRLVAAASKAGPDAAMVCSSKLNSGTLIFSIVALMLLLPHMSQGRDVTEERIEPSRQNIEEHPAIQELCARLPNGEAISIWTQHCLAKGQRALEGLEKSLSSERHVYLLLFAAFLQSQGMRPLEAFSCTFEEWMLQSTQAFGLADLLRG